MSFFGTLEATTLIFNLDKTWSVCLFWQIDIKVNIWITLAYTFVSNVNIFNLFDILSVEWIFRPSEWTFLPWPSCFNFWLFHAINCLGLLRITWLLIEINLDSFWAKKCHDNYRYFWSKKLCDKFWKKISNYHETVTMNISNIEKLLSLYFLLKDNTWKHTN